MESCGRKEGDNEGLIYSPLSIFALLLFLYFFPCLCFAGCAYQIAAPFRSSARGRKPDASVSLSFNLSVSPTFFPCSPPANL